SGLVGDIDLTSDDLFSLSRSPQYLLDLQQNYSNQDLLSEASSISQTRCDKKSQATSSTGVATNNNSNKTATSSNASKPNKKLKISSAS
ncbi:306_t:CDS:2, partial [Entrophospora sp. SA101]